MGEVEGEKKEDAVEREDGDGPELLGEADDVGDLDRDIGVQVPDELTKKEVELLASDGVMEKVEAKIEELTTGVAEDDEDTTLHDPNSLIKDALAELEEEGRLALDAGAAVAGIADDQCRSAWHSWAACFRSSVSAARFADRPGPVPPPSQNTSLLLFPAGDALVVSFIHWVRGDLKKGAVVGRQVLTDEDGKLVFSVGAAFPRIEFRSKRYPDGRRFTVIVDDTGVPMQQVRRPERPVMLPAVLRMREMCEIALSRKATLDSDCAAEDGHKPMLLHASGVSPCFICEKSTMPLVTCAVCTQTSHGDCIERVVSWAIGCEDCAQEFLDLRCTNLPRLFVNTMCKLCAHTGLVRFEP